MSEPRDLTLTPAQLELKIASDEAVDSAGGQVKLAQRTGRPQSRFSDWCSRNTGAFMPIDVVGEVEDRSAGSPGWPHITRALALRQGFDLIRRPEAEEMDEAQLHAALGRHSKEAGDVTAAICAELAKAKRFDPRGRTKLLRECDEAIAALVNLRGLISGIGEP